MTLTMASAFAFPLPHTRGSSHGHTRQTRRLYADKLYADMAEASQTGWRELELATGVQLFRKTGALLTGPESHADIVHCEAMFRGSTYPHRVFKGAELHEQYPQFTFPSGTVGILDENGGLLFANKCLLAFWEQFKRLGGTIRDCERLLQLESLSQDQVIVKTNAGQYSSKSVVLCLGPWTKSFISKTFGLELNLTVQLISYFFGRESTPGAYSIENGTPSMNMFDVDGRHYYAWPSYEYPGMVKLGIHQGLRGDPDFPNGVDHSEQDALIRSFYKRTWPHLDGSFPVTERCIYTQSKNSDFILDCIPGHSNVAVAAGFSGHGFKFAPIVGDIMADIVTGRRPKPYSPRFQIHEHLLPHSRL